MIRGLAAIPKKWSQDDGTAHFLAATNINDYPFLLLSCDLGSNLNCQAKRTCFVNHNPKLRDIRSVAVNPKSQEVLQLDLEARAIHIYRYHSCYSINYLRTMAIPERIKLPSAVAVDQSNHLFVATEELDDYHSANLYFWQEDQWRQQLSQK